MVTIIWFLKFNQKFYYFFFLIDLTVTPLIMKKNVDCIETIKSLQNYDSSDSLQNASKIRNIAKKIYKKFQVLFK